MELNSRDSGQAGNVDVRLYNTMGQEIRRVINQALPAGEHSHEFYVSDLSPGCQLYTKNAG